LRIAVADDVRGHGIRAALIEALAAKHFTELALSVHLRNPAARLYTRCGFQVSGKGRGPFGVAMTRRLRD
jgi:GNAT superfamily N-acetyltransferase